MVLDLGRQPSWDRMPPVAEPLPDPAHLLRMWWCRACGLAQLVEDADAVEEVPGIEPQAMLDQTERSIARMGEQELLRPGATVVEFGSPHGESWLSRLVDRGLVEQIGSGPADLVIDCYGLLHEPDQEASLRARAAALAPGGTLVIQLHSFATMLRTGQWYDLRHGHFAYWSVPALDGALRRHGLGVHRAWWYPLAGGTVLITATRTPAPDAATRALIESERAEGVCDGTQVRRLQDDAASAVQLRDWLAAERAAGRLVLGYGAASRSVPLVCHAGIDADLLQAIADASPAKQGKRMPGTRIPIVSPAELVARAPDRVLLFLAGLADEVRGALPGVEDAGGRWVVLDPSPTVMELSAAS
ncbi:transferase [Pseudonocardia asaccharolytica DSM 44247 = NBRC 16224]|uniref:Transferase n=1 Tax=Pseudonocardia asaccharolytica DSM 44247 = NBRC 16224 TaxID=1123024 RepID=A0A511D4G0_9PSEU|nr:transferase [Pseudonocardia asaccharolytica DSM 44247 = NBRC 16224]